MSVLNQGTAGLERAESILARNFSDFVVSKQRLRKAEGICLVRERRQNGGQTVGFAARPFVLCGLPIRRPPKEQLLFERRNGHFILQVTGHPQFGLPFGQDRLVPIFLATLAVRQKSQTVRFGSAAEIFDTFGMARGGKEYRRLVAAFERIFGATIFFGTESIRTTAKVVHRARFNFLSEAQIWYDRDSPRAPQADGFANMVVLSDEFYREIADHPIPADLEAVKLLSSAPAVLDLFVWLTYRSYVSKGPENIPLFGSFGLARQLGSTDYSRPRRFRAMLEQWLTTIRALWPDCPAALSRDGKYLSLQRAQALQEQPL